MKSWLTLMRPVIPEKLPLLIKPAVRLSWKIRAAWLQQGAWNLDRRFGRPQ